MKDKIIYIIKGFFFGIANVIPGVSGGTIAITMGIYEELIGSISNFFKDPKKSIKYLIPIGIGAVLSILSMSKLISYSLDKYPAPTTLFFIGLIIGGIPLLTRKVKNEKVKPLNIILFLITFGIVMAMTFMGSGTNELDFSNINLLNIILLLLIGMVAAGTMVIPGISGSFVLMLIGAYKPIIGVVGDLTNFSNLTYNLSVLAPFGIGVVIGIIGIAKILEYLFKNFEVQTYYAVLGFIIASIIALITGIIGVKVSTMELVIGIILFIVGTIIGYKLGEE